MSRGQNSKASGICKCRVASAGGTKANVSVSGAGGTEVNVVDGGRGIKLASGKHAKRVRIKRGMRGSCKWAERHRLETHKLTKQRMSADELLATLGRRKLNSDDLSPSEVEELLSKAAKDVDEQLAIENEKEAVEKRRTVMSTKVKTHGDWLPELKGDDNVTFLSADLNSLAYWSRYSNKADRLRDIFAKYGIDSAGLQEVCVNWAQLPASKTLAQILRNAAKNIRSVASYNKREGKERGTGKVQRGGTATILRDELTAYVTNSGADPSGLGRWSWYLLQGEEGFRTRVISAYAPCGSAASKDETYYQQQARYIIEKAVLMNGLVE